MVFKGYKIFLDDVLILTYGADNIEDNIETLKSFYIDYGNPIRLTDEEKYINLKFFRNRIKKICRYCDEEECDFDCLNNKYSWGL